MPSDGFFVGPSAFDDVSPEMVIGREEIFGPVAGIHRVNTHEDAIKVMEAHPNANATSIFTSSGKAARDFAHRATASMVQPGTIAAAYSNLSNAERKMLLRFVATR